MKTRPTLTVGDILDALSKLDRNTPVAVSDYHGFLRVMQTLSVVSRDDSRIIVFDEGYEPVALAEDVMAEVDLNLRNDTVEVLAKTE